MDEPMNQEDARVALIVDAVSELLPPPAFRRVHYQSQPLTKGTSHVALAQVNNADRIPTKLESVNMDPFFTQLDNHLIELFRRPDLPLDFLQPHGMVWQQAAYTDSMAPNVTPFGEHGLCHLLDAGLFQKLNALLSRLFPTQIRYWAFVGIGATGKTDFGFFVDGAMRLVLEVKPNIRVNATLLGDLLTAARLGQGAYSLLSQADSVGRLASQIYAQFCSPDARNVRYALLLNEALIGDEGNTTTSMLLFERRAATVAVHQNLIGESPFVLGSQMTQISTAATLLALSTLAVDMYQPPEPPAHDIPRPPRIRPHQHGPSTPNPPSRAPRRSVRIIEHHANPTGQGLDGATRNVSIHSPLDKQSKSAYLELDPVRMQEAAASLADLFGLSSPMRDLSPFTPLDDFTPPPAADSPVDLPVPLDGLTSLPVCTIRDAKSSFSRSLLGPISLPLDPSASPLIKPLSQKSFVVQDFRGKGSVWKVFSLQREDALAPLVLKTCNLASFPVEGEYDQWTRSAAVHDIQNELLLLSGLLMPLQTGPDAVIPRFRGAYVAQDDALFWATVMEDGGQSLEGRPLTMDHKQQLINAYTLLHRIGIVHGDAHPRNWLIDDDGHIALIDFGQACQYDTCTVGRALDVVIDIYHTDPERKSWAINCASEMRRVRKMLGAKFCIAFVSATDTMMFDFCVTCSLLVDVIFLVFCTGGNHTGGTLTDG